VRCAQLGSKTAAMSRLVLVEYEREKYIQQVAELEEVLSKVREGVKNVQNRLQLLKLSSSRQDAARESAERILNSQLKALQTKKEWAEERRKRTLRFLEVLPDREDIIVADTLFPVLQVSIYGQDKEYKTAIGKWRIGWKTGSICMEST
jgi:uncharacterized protein (DUF342 family)